MITLNLIPEALKKAHTRIHIHHILRNNLLLIFVVMTLIAIAVLFGRIFLENRFITTIEETTQTTGRIQSPVTQDIQLSNNILKIAKNIQDEYRPWQLLLITMGEVTPDNVSINQIGVSQEGNSLKILGNAADRDSFLKFKDNLENNNLFLSISSPIANILNKTNINFSLDIILNTSLLE